MIEDVTAGWRFRRRAEYNDEDQDTAADRVYVHHSRGEVRIFVGLAIATVVACWAWSFFVGLSDAPRAQPETVWPESPGCAAVERDAAAWTQ